MSLNNAYSAINMEAGQTKLANTLRKACKKIAPVWPLENFVAVNPYLGLTDQPFEQAAACLAKVGGIQSTLGLAFYLEAYDAGQMTMEDLDYGLTHVGHALQGDPTAFIESIRHAKVSEKERWPTVKTVLDIATTVTDRDWGRLAVARISSWASAYFDQGQALWSSADQQTGLYAAWQSEAAIDRTPHVMGLKGFHRQVKDLPRQPLAAAAWALQQLGVPGAGLPLYLHRLLVRVGGWSAYVARIDWDNELSGEEDGALVEFLCILLAWEACVLNALSHNPEVVAQWVLAAKRLPHISQAKAQNPYFYDKLALQAAYDRAGQHKVITGLASQGEANTMQPSKPNVQAIFCIDVRSEVFRRNLEMAAPDVETIGFAGFFAFPVKYVPIGHQEGNAQCPVLLTTGHTVMESMPEERLHQQTVERRQLKHQVRRAWKSFKLGAISCFSFVGPVGLSYLPKLFTDAFGWTRPVPHPDQEGIKKAQFELRRTSLDEAQIGGEAVGIPMEDRIEMAKSALKAMSLIEEFAQLVLIVGHGSSTVNNPHATGLDCGACGGHTGEANARVAAAVLNDTQVRERLKSEGIAIPETTWFLACQHDTTTDEVGLFHEDEVPQQHLAALNTLKNQLAEAGRAARTERAIRMRIKPGQDVCNSVKARSKDWAQVRPEWGLAGCSAFVVAPRHRTQGKNLGGRAFLHSYDWQKDQDFSVLELIMTAPMVVTSWISLQYYASTVDNQFFGAGNKTLHNITGGIGVLEGACGDLRVGLPWQSVHDGQKFQHEPLKLNVVIEAPREAMNKVLAKHPGVRDLCNHGWLNLLAMDGQGEVSHRYAGNFQWEPLTEVFHQKLAMV